jgi:hypothetical protein
MRRRSRPLTKVPNALTDSINHERMAVLLSEEAEAFRNTVPTAAEMTEFMKQARERFRCVEVQTSMVELAEAAQRAWPSRIAEDMLADALAGQQSSQKRQTQRERPMAGFGVECILRLVHQFAAVPEKVSNVRDRCRKGTSR